jgi:hypothetical protein
MGCRHWRIVWHWIGACRETRTTSRISLRFRGFKGSLTREFAVTRTQGLNVVMVALDDDTMKKAFDSMKTKYKNVQFRSCGVDLGKKGQAQIDFEFGWLESSF